MKKITDLSTMKNFLLIIFCILLSQNINAQEKHVPRFSFGIGQNYFNYKFQTDGNHFKFDKIASILIGAELINYVNTKIKIDAQGNYTPNTSISATFNASTETKAIFRDNVALDRDQVLTTFVGGSEYENATYIHDIANLSVKRMAEKFEYIFDVFYTNL